MTAPAEFFEYLLRLADDRLILGHRLSEWAGHAPILEEDIALANIALDLVGQAQALLALAGEVEGQGRDEDALAYFREAREFRNALLCEQPNGDFAVTLVRQLLFDAWDVEVTGALAASPHETLAGIMAKAHKEARYHLRHSSQWVIRLGDGTSESHARAQTAVDELWRFGPELCVPDAVDAALVPLGLAADLDAIRPCWEATLRDVLATATLVAPPSAFLARGGRIGQHSEHLGHLLAEMQIVARSHPGATW